MPVVGGDAGIVGATGGRGNTGGSGSPSTGGGDGGGIGVSGSGGRTGSTGGDGTGGAGTGGLSCAVGITGAGGAGAAGGGAAAQYEFETSAQLWKAGVGSETFASVATSTDQRFSGQASLAGTINAISPGVYILEVEPPVPAVAPGAAITFHVRVPNDPAVAWAQPYVLDQAYTFTGVYAPFACLVAGAWTTVVLNVPADAAVPIRRLGVQFYVQAGFNGALYVDTVSW